MPRRTSAFIAGFLASLVGLHATASSENSRLSTTATPGAYLFTWHGIPARSYFLQSSEDLSAWTTMPIIEVGAGQAIQYGFSTSSPRIFFRLRFSDLAALDVRAADFDGDGISNWDEIQTVLDPFKADSDGDGMPDGYEITWGLIPTIMDGGEDKDGDGVRNDEDARPASAAIGRLSVTITAPANAP